MMALLKIELSTSQTRVKVKIELQSHDLYDHGELGVDYCLLYVYFVHLASKVNYQINNGSINFQSVLILMVACNYD